MDPSYTTWVFHGEQVPNCEDESDVDMSKVHRMYRDAYNEVDGNANFASQIGDEDFTKKLEDVETPLYEGCTKYTKLSAAIVLYKLKAIHGGSDKFFDELLQALIDMLPEANTLPDSTYSTKKLLKVFDLGFEKIDACVKDCCLFRKDLEHHETCPKCGSSRWKVNKHTKEIQKGVPAKVLRYFPIIPRFKRMFKDAEMAKNLVWHHTHKSQDGNMRHPVDSPAWEVVDNKWPNFAFDPRNLRLGLATDGFNPYSQLSSKYSCWPDMLVTYNLHPWLAMSKENLMLTLLILGPKQPGNDIDVYLQPLIEDLRILWNEGVEMFDAFNNSTFSLKAMLMWTINDYPTYGNLVGCCTKGKYACAACGIHTQHLRLRHSNKHVYMSHRRFLPPNHEFRKRGEWFDGNNEDGERPRVLTGEEVLHACEEVEIDLGKSCTKRKRQDPKQIWKKKSIFFELPYWKNLLVRHNLDVMHIEKNICDSIVGTLLNLKGKTKDGLNSRKDLKELGIRDHLHVDEEGKNIKLPPAPYNLSKEEKKIFCTRLYNLKLSDGYSSNISNCVVLSECKLVGLKSHDCHVLIQQLLVVALRGLLPKGPRNAIFRLCAFFNQLCQRVIDKSVLESLESEVDETLCMLER